MKSYSKRFSFQISTDAYTELKAIATQKGTTMTNLIRLWIQDSQEQLILKPRNKFSTLHLFNLRLSKDLTEKVTNTSKSLGVTNSTFLRALIRYQIVVNSNNKLTKSCLFKDRESLYMKANSLYLKGELLKVNHLLERHSLKEEKLLILYIKNNRDLWNLPNLEKARSIIENKYQHGELKKQSQLFLEKFLIDIKIDFVSSNNSESLRNLEIIKSNILNSGNSYLIGIMNYFYGEIMMHDDDAYNAYNYFENALDYLDINNYPIELIKIYLRLASLSINNLQKEHTERYLNKALKIILKFNNKNLLGWYYALSSQNALLKGDLSLFRSNIEKSKKHYKEAGSDSGAYFVHEYKAKSDLINGNTQKAQENCIAAERYGKRIGRKGTDRNEMYRALSISKINYEKGRKLMNSVSPRLLKYEKPDFVKYSSAVIDYVYGPNQKTRSKGELALRSIAQNPEYRLSQRASIQTIKTSKFSFIK